MSKHTDEPMVVDETPEDIVAKSEYHLLEATDRLPVAERALMDAKASPATDLQELLDAAKAVQDARSAIATAESLLKAARSAANQGDRNILSTTLADYLRDFVTANQDEFDRLELTGASLAVVVSDEVSCIPSIVVRFSGPGVLTTRQKSESTGIKAPRAPKESAGVVWSKVCKDNGVDPAGNSAHRVAKSKLTAIHDSIAHDCNL